MSIILSVDGIVLIDKGPIGLQVLLTTKYIFMPANKLEISCKTTKIIMFSKGQSKPHRKWNIANSDLEVVNQRCYQGILFQRRVSFACPIENQIPNAV